ncbi:hypothetical protein [Fodinicola feengrottensis]|uniref:hypothetical protein n=1 Tax=Fodinicola feengrottensis TaxID=435914 RepID=UPI0031E3A4F0
MTGMRVVLAGSVQPGMRLARGSEIVSRQLLTTSQRVVLVLHTGERIELDPDQPVTIVGDPPRS